MFINKNKGQSILQSSASAHRLHYIIFVIRRDCGQLRTPSMCRQFFETVRTVHVQQNMRKVNVETAQVVLHMCRAHPSALIHVWVYFESCVDAAVRETEKNVESEVYPGLKPGSTHEAASARAESASLRVISEIWLLLQCATALQRALCEADALEQRRPCTRTSATTKKMFTHTLSNRSLEPCMLTWRYCDTWSRRIIIKWF